MAKLALASDFKEFLKLLASNEVEYLLVGGYAVALHGYIRSTNDLDIWVRSIPANAENIVNALRKFGFRGPELIPEIFLKPDRIEDLAIPTISLPRLKQNKSASGRAKDLADLENLP